MSKLEPKNQEEAFTYQWEDDIKVCRAAANTGIKKTFLQALQTLEIHIEAYKVLSKKQP